MLHTPERPRAARRDPDGSRRKFDGIWQQIRAECNRQDAEAQAAAIAIAAPDADTESDPSGRLPKVIAACERDRLAGWP